MRQVFGIWAGALLAVAAPAAAQQDIQRPGTNFHDAAGAAFPEQVGDFRRVRVTQFDEAGRDISATYRLERPAGTMVMTVYIYPATPAAAGGRTQSCDREFEEVRQAIREQYKDAELTEDGAAPAVDGVAGPLGRRSVYRLVAPFAGEAQPVRSEVDLYCYVGGDWLVKYRATSPAALDAAGAVEQFIRSGPWPGRGAPVDPKDVAALPAFASPS
jgi:hypothetical protein